jgi:ribosome-binding protein aMBF1 (putative translation factor)
LRNAPAGSTIHAYTKVEREGKMSARVAAVGLKKVDGEKVRQLREGRTLSTRELAELSGVSGFTINDVELGKRRVQPKTLRKLAEALNVLPRELLLEESEDA